MNDKPKFSVRAGVQPAPTPIREEVPEALRYFLLKYIEGEYRGYPSQAAEVFEDFLRTPGLREKFYNPHDPTVWTRLYAYIKGFKWWQVYDFIEAIFAREKNSYERENFVAEVNKVLAAENTCWRMEKTGEIAYKGAESFETAVRTAKAVLASTGRNTAKDEIHKALEDFSKRPQPDLTGAVQHAIAALECVAKDACGTTGETLGQLVKRQDKFPQPVGQAVGMLYGFASNNGRHITEGREPEPKEVELIVGIAAVVATYLSR